MFQRCTNYGVLHRAAAPAATMNIDDCRERANLIIRDKYIDLLLWMGAIRNVLELRRRNGVKCLVRRVYIRVFV